MKHVKRNIIGQLQTILQECNMAASADISYANDLDPSNHDQQDAYGHISNALRCIGGDEMVEYWIEHGEFAGPESDTTDPDYYRGSDRWSH